MWLTQAQIAILFGTKRPAITKHLINIFKTCELEKNSVCSILEHTASDGKKYKTQFYNLDAIITVGYRVNSFRATQFRIWATKVLKNYLVQGYALNEQRLLEQSQKLKKLQTTINYISQKSSLPELKGHTEELLSLIQQYADSFTLLYQYDENKVIAYKTRKSRFILKYDECKHLIEHLKKNLIEKKEASDLFGKEINNKFNSIIGTIYQTFDKNELYSTIEEKARKLFEEEAREPKASEVAEIKNKVKEYPDYLPQDKDLEILRNWAKNPEIYLDEEQLKRFIIIRKVISGISFCMLWELEKYPLLRRE